MAQYNGSLDCFTFNITPFIFVPIQPIHITIGLFRSSNLSSGFIYPVSWARHKFPHGVIKVILWCIKKFLFISNNKMIFSNIVNHHSFFFFLSLLYSQFWIIILLVSLIAMSGVYFPLDRQLRVLLCYCWWRRLKYEPNSVLQKNP